jgi:hypothetical protein
MAGHRAKTDGRAAAEMAGDITMERAAGARRIPERTLSSPVTIPVGTVVAIIVRHWAVPCGIGSVAIIICTAGQREYGGGTHSE